MNRGLLFTILYIADRPYNTGSHKGSISKTKDKVLNRNVKTNILFWKYIILENEPVVGMTNGLLNPVVPSASVGLTTRRFIPLGHKGV